MTPEQRARLRALEQAATKGPWEQRDTDPGIISDGRGNVVIIVAVHNNRMIADSRFVAESRNLLPALLDYIDRLEKVKEAAKALDEGKGQILPVDPYKFRQLKNVIAQCEEE